MTTTGETHPAPHFRADVTGYYDPTALDLGQNREVMRITSLGQTRGEMLDDIATTRRMILAHLYAQEVLVHRFWDEGTVAQQALAVDTPDETAEGDA